MTAVKNETYILFRSHGCSTILLQILFQPTKFYHQTKEPKNKNMAKQLTQVRSCTFLPSSLVTNLSINLAEVDIRSPHLTFIFPPSDRSIDKLPNPFFMEFGVAVPCVDDKRG